MTDDRDLRRLGARARPRLGGLRIARIAGIDVHLDLSLIIVFALITTSLGAGVFPSWHPDWSPVTSWLTALAAAVVFFVSILLHELSHAVVGRRFGAEIRGITLFIFGGVAHLEREPRGWKAELLMALAGPAASIVIGLVCSALAGVTVDPARLETGDPRQVFGDLGPAATLFAWVGPVNIVIALFNLVPGFPLDGGRALRAVLWGVTGDLHKATRWASRMGQLFAWFLIVSGLAMLLGLRVPIFGSGAVSGLWIAFIGWFLNNAALMGYRQLIVRDALDHVAVSRLMDRDVRTIRPGMKLDRLVEDELLCGPQRCFPVVDDGRLEGLVCLEDIRRAAREAWPETPVERVMTPRGQLVTVDADADAADALEQLSRSGVDQLPVMEGETFKGLLRREGILRWLSLHGDPEGQAVGSTMTGSSDGDAGRRSR